MNRINLFADVSQLDNKAKMPLRLAGSATAASPITETYLPSVFTGPDGDPYVVWVDFTSGNDTAALAATGSGSDMRATTVVPFATFGTAWNTTVTYANANPSRKYVIRLKNVGSSSYISGGATINIIPIYPNVLVQGDGIDTTVFNASGDTLQFNLDSLAAASQFFLQFADLTLPHVYIVVLSATAPDAVGYNLTQPSFIRGNGTTGIFYDIIVTGSSGAEGSPTSTEVAANGGGSGGNIQDLVIEGFVAVNNGTATLTLSAGSGGKGGTANAYYTGEYSMTEAYGTPGFGGTPGMVSNIFVKNMTARPYCDGTQITTAGGWSINAHQGAVGAGGTYDGGTLSGTTGGTPGYPVGGATTQALIVMHSDVLNLRTTGPGDIAIGYGTVRMVFCSIGFQNSADRYLIVYELQVYLSLMHPSVSINAASTYSVSNSPTSDLFTV